MSFLCAKTPRRELLMDGSNCFGCQINLKIWQLKHGLSNHVDPFSRIQMNQKTQYHICWTWLSCYCTSWRELSMDFNNLEWKFEMNLNGFLLAHIWSVLDCNHVCWISYVTQILLTQMFTKIACLVKENFYYESVFYLLSKWNFFLVAKKPSPWMMTENSLVILTLFNIALILYNL